MQSQRRRKIRSISCPKISCDVYYSPGSVWAPSIESSVVLRKVATSRALYGSWPEYATCPLGRGRRFIIQEKENREVLRSLFSSSDDSGNDKDGRMTNGPMT